LGVRWLEKKIVRQRKEEEEGGEKIGEGESRRGEGGDKRG
jgi:hypothetical protein